MEYYDVLDIALYLQSPAISDFPAAPRSKYKDMETNHDIIFFIYYSTYLGPCIISQSDTYSPHSYGIITDKGSSTKLGL